MIPRQEEFRRAFIAEGGSAGSAASYLTYLRAIDSACGGIDVFLESQSVHALVDWCNRQPRAVFGTAKNGSNCRSAAARYAKFLAHVPSALPDIVRGDVNPTFAAPAAEIIEALLREAKDLGARYYSATGKPLGVTAEIAELEAAAKLGLSLCPPRTPWYDAVDLAGRKVQIKGKAVDPARRNRGMCSAIKCSDAFDDVALVLLDKTTLECLEIWVAGQATVAKRVAGLLSERRRSSSTLAVTQFKSVATPVWP